MDGLDLNLIEYIKMFLSDNEIPFSKFCWCNIDTQILINTPLEGMNIEDEERTGSDFDTWVRIIELPKLSKFLMIHGYYSSWNGIDFDDCTLSELTEVKKVTKLVEVTTWESI